MTIFAKLYLKISHLARAKKYKTMKKIILFLLCVMASIHCAIAQTNSQTSFCGTPPMTRAVQERLHPNAVQPYLRGSGTTIYVPLTLHVLGTDGGGGYAKKTLVYEALCTLQGDFAPYDIKFYIKDSILYHNRTAWYDHADFTGGADMVQNTQVPNTCNTYFVANPAGNCGYAWYGGSIVLGNNCASKDSHTWAHEAGHYFSLPHTFVGWEGNTYSGGPAPAFLPSGEEVELVDRTNCTTAADQFCDTPTDFINYRWNCDANGESSPLQDPNGTTFKANGTYFMSYSNDGCMNKFSLEQAAAMRGYINSNLPTLLSHPVPNYAMPSNVSGLLPLDSTINIPVAGVSFTWTKSINATKYLFELSRTSIFANSSTQEFTATDTVLTVNNLYQNRKYYWRVRPLNEQYTCATTSPVNRFYTGFLVSTEAAVSPKIDFTVQPTLLSQGAPILLQFSSDTDLAKAQISLLDATGKTVFSTIINDSINDFVRIPTTNCSAGVYFVQVQGASGAVSARRVLVY